MNDPLRYSVLVADAGIPMIFLTFPAMLILLAPVVLLEALLYKKWLGIKTGKAFIYSTWSNIASLAVGIPVAWLVMFVVEVLFFEGLGSQIDKLGNSPLADVISLLVGSAWLGPTPAPWDIAAACLVMLVPFFLASYGVEYWAVRFMMRHEELSEAALRDVQIAVRNANLVSYTALFVGTSVWLVWSYLHAHARSS
jgi:hypothetical protein